jgi:AraC-like DNA-binding protein
MVDAILHRWIYRAHASHASAVVPDGCRDLIMHVLPGERPSWFISPLDAHAREVRIEANALLHGFRLRPGVRIDDTKLLALVREQDPDRRDLACRINACSTLSPAVAEALQCLANEKTSVRQTAARLGVSPRSLQRLMLSETDRSPSFWIQLARVRKASRAVCEGKSLVEIAFEYGFSDQPHMTRQFRYWLNVSPAALRKSPALGQALTQSGYG